MREYVVCLKDPKGGTLSVTHKAASEAQVRKDLARWYPKHVIVSIT